MTAKEWIVPLNLVSILIIYLATSIQTASVSWQETVRKRAPDFRKCPKKFGFDRPLLMVHSYDGFGARFMDRVPSMKFLSEQALRAQHMRPVFPTSTFANHYAMVTGLYAESHGIIDQSFPSADNKSLFENSKPSHFISDFWKGQPIWQVAQRQGRKVFVRYWPGSDVVINGVQPTNWTVYTDLESVDSRIDTIMGWINLPKEQRPDMVISYLQEPDKSGHESLEKTKRFGSGLQQVDHHLGLLMTRLTEAGITDCVDLIVLSDHGLVECLHTVDPHVERAGPVAVDQGKLGTMNRVKLSQHADIDKAASLLTCDSEYSPYQIYTKQTLPVRLHYINAEVIPPIIIVANMSYILYPTGGNHSCAGKTVHGWDNIYSKMQALFLAYGPSFKVKNTVEPFENVELFGLFCDLLNITCIPTNGTVGSLRHVLSPAKQKGLPRPENDFGAISSVVRNAKLNSDGRSDIIICADNCPQKVNFSALEQLAPSFNQNGSELGSLPRVSYSGARHMDINILLNHDYTAGHDSKRQMVSWTKFGLPKTPGVQLRQKLKDGKFSCQFADPRLGVKPSWTLPCAGLNVNETDRSAKLMFAPMYPPELTTKPEYQAEPLLAGNMVPMYSTFYNGYWKALLRLIASWNTVLNPLTVYVGPTWDREAPLGTVDYFDAGKAESGNFIPTHFYLIAVKQRDTPTCRDVSCSLDVISFILPHQPKPKKPCQSERFYLLTNTASVKDVERITGLRFFADLPWQEAARLRTRLTDYLWDDRIPL